MIERTILPALGNMFSSIVGWFSSIVEAVDGNDVIITAFMILLIVSLLFIPLRGASIGGPSFLEFTSQVTHKGKYSSGKFTSNGLKRYRGKFESNNTSAKLARKRKYRSG